MRSLKLMKNYISYLALTIFAIASANLSSQAMENEISVFPENTVAVKKIHQDINGNPIEQSIEEYTENFATNFINSLKHSGEDLNNIIIIVNAVGGNYDLLDDERLFFKGQRVNSSLDCISYQTMEHLKNLNLINKIYSPSKNVKKKIFYVMINKADITTYELDNKQSKFDAILPEIKFNKTSQCNFGGKFYGTTTQMNAYKAFVKKVAELLDYVWDDESKTYYKKGDETKQPQVIAPLIYYMLNDWGKGNHAEGSEVRYSKKVPYSKNLAEEIYEYIKQTLNSEERVNYPKSMEDEGVQRRTIMAGNDVGQPTALIHVDFGNNPKKQEQLLTPDVQNRVAMGTVYGIAKWLNMNPLYACVTIKPNVEIEPGRYEFLVEAHLKNYENMPIKQGMIVIGRADLDSNFWDEEQNNKLLNVVKDSDGKFKLLRNFEPIKDGARCNAHMMKLASKDGKNDDYSNRFYISVYYPNGVQMFSDVTSFTLKEPNQISNNKHGVDVVYNQVSKFNTPIISTPLMKTNLFEN